MCFIYDKYRYIQRVLLTPLFIPSITVGMWIFIIVGIVDFATDVLVWNNTLTAIQEMKDAQTIISNFNQTELFLEVKSNVTIYYENLSTEARRSYCNVPAILEGSSVNFSLHTIKILIIIPCITILCNVFLFSRCVLFCRFSRDKCDEYHFGKLFNDCWEILLNDLSSGELMLLANRMITHMGEDACQIGFIFFTYYDLHGPIGAYCTIQVSSWEVDTWSELHFKNHSLSDNYFRYWISIASCVISALITQVSVISHARRIKNWRESIFKMIFSLILTIIIIEYAHRAIGMSLGYIENPAKFPWGCPGVFLSIMLWPPLFLCFIVFFFMYADFGCGYWCSRHYPTLNTSLCILTHTIYYTEKTKPEPLDSTICELSCCESFSCNISTDSETITNDDLESLAQSPQLNPTDKEIDDLFHCSTSDSIPEIKPGSSFV